MNINRGGGIKSFCKEGNTYTCLVNLLDKCNYNCSYCSNQTQKGGHNILNKDSLLKLFNAISKLDRTFYRFAFAGGEPFLYPNLDQLLAGTLNIFGIDNIELRIASNMSVPSHKMHPVFEQLSRACISSIYASVHFEQLDLNAYVRNLSALPAEYKQLVKFKLLASKSALPMIEKTIDMLSNAGFTRYHVGLVYDVGSGITAKLNTKEQEQAILLSEKYPRSADPYFNEYIDNKTKTVQTFSYDQGIADTELVNYKHMWCSAGRNSIRVGADGSIRRCFGFLPELNINDIDTELDKSFIEPVVCRAKQCICGSMIWLPKWRDKTDAPVFI